MSIIKKFRKLFHKYLLSDQELLKSATKENAKDYVYNFTRAKILDIYDGDTVIIGAVIDNTVYKFNARIYGIDCDEIKSPIVSEALNAKLAKEYLSHLILGKIVDINVLNNKYENIPGTTKTSKITEKYGRLLVQIDIDEKSIANEMIEKQLARPYFGKTKEKYPLYPNFENILKLIDYQ